MSRLEPLLCVILGFFFASVLQATDTPPALAVQLSDTSVTISNATAGSRVLLVAETISVQRGLLRRDELEAIVTADEGGLASYTPLRGVPLRSAWVAVETETGRYAVAAPEGFPLELHTLGEVTPAINSTTVTIETSALLGVLVHPATRSAWAARGVDGGGSQRDGQDDGVVRLDLSAGSPLTSGGVDTLPGSSAQLPEPSVPVTPQLTPGDTVVLIDCRTLAVTIGTVGA